MLFPRLSVAGGTRWLCVCGCFCLSVTQDASAQQTQIVQREHQRIHAALDEPAEWKLTDVQLTDFAAFLGEHLDANVLIDCTALEDFGISTDTPVTFNITGISRRSALNLLLRDLELTWMVRDGALWISTIEEQESELITKTYPVGDLVRTTVGDYEYDTLIDTITASIDPASWDQVGGPGSIEPIYAAIVVSQVRQAHEQIEYLLRGCRKLRQQLAEHPGTVPRPAALDGTGGKKIRQELENPTAVDLTDVELVQAVEYFADKHDIPIVIDTNALEDFGIGRDQPITCQTKRLPLRNTLRILLGQLELTFVVRDEVLLVTTIEEEEALLQTVIYPVGDLVAPMEGRPADRERYLDDAAPAFAALDFDSLIDTVTTTVGPDSGDAVGGPSSIEVLPQPTALLISQTEKMHEQIIDLLTEMRRVKSLEQQRLEKTARAESESAQHFVEAYSLELAGDKPVMMKELLDLVHISLGPEAWQDERALLHPVGSTLVVRHTRRVHRSIRRLLEKVGVLKGPMGGFSQPSQSGLEGKGGLF